MPKNVILLDQSSKIEYTTEIVIEICCSCAMPFGMPKSLQQAAIKDHDLWFYCAAGHRQHYTGQTEEDKLRKQLTAARQRADSAEQTAKYQRGRAETAERSKIAYKGVATRQRNRIARGVCPCCNRYFPEMDQHMITKHPQYAGEPLVPGDG